MDGPAGPVLKSRVPTKNKPSRPTIACSVLQLHTHIYKLLPSFLPSFLPTVHPSSLPPYLSLILLLSPPSLLPLETTDFTLEIEYQKSLYLMDVTEGLTDGGIN